MTITLNDKPGVPTFRFVARTRVSPRCQAARALLRSVGYAPRLPRSQHDGAEPQESVKRASETDEADKRGRDGRRKTDEKTDETEQSDGRMSQDETGSRKHSSGLHLLLAP